MYHGPQAIVTDFEDRRHRISGIHYLDTSGRSKGNTFEGTDPRNEDQQEDGQKRCDEPRAHRGEEDSA